MSNTTNVKLGICKVSFNAVDLGYTQGGVEVSVSTDTHRVEVDQFGKTAINELIMGRNVKVKVPLAETTLENLVATMPGATLVTDGVAASGSITITTNPTNAQTITVNGKTITFKTTAAVANDVTLGATAALTAAALSAVLAGSSDSALNVATYSVAGAVVSVTYGTRSTAGNAYTIVTGTAAGAVTMSGATLTGGAVGTSTSVTVTTGAGLDLLTLAKELRLHPKKNASNDISEDFVIYKAGTAGALTFAYKVDAERIFNVEFNGYPDAATDLLFGIGVAAA